MLVLSRKEDQKIRFPELGITVQVLQVKGSTVRIGLEAPTEVRIIRDELLDDERPGQQRTHRITLPQKQRHELRNQLNALSIAMHLFKQEVEAGYHEDAETTFKKLVEHLEAICSHGALSSTQKSNSQSDLTALLIEDEPNEREMLAGFLRLHGYEITTAADGVEALEYLESNIKPSLILVDMQMPRCDGPTTIRMLRQNPAFDGIKIFGISGSTPEENQLDVEDGDISGWFMKPLNPKRLVEAMVSTADSCAA